MKNQTRKIQIKSRRLFKFGNGQNNQQLITHPTTSTIHTNTTVMIGEPKRD